MRRAVFLSIALLALPGAGAAAAEAPTAKQSIVGGQDAAIADWPSIAFLLAAWDANGDGRLDQAAGCTGTVIAPEWILSAAHCAFRPDGGPVVAMLSITGVANFNDLLGEVIPADRLVVHPGWDPRRMRGDALLIHLETPSSRPPMPLARPGGRYGENPAVPNAAGWGTTDENSLAGTDVLKQAFLDLVDDPTCAAFAAGIDPATQLCAGSVNVAGACHGDSGGPLTVLDAAGRRRLWGLTSYGPQLALGLPPCSLRSPAVFTRVAALAGWVDATLALPTPARAASSSLPPADSTAPVIGDARLSRKRFKAAGRGAALARAAGTRLSFTLSEAAAVRITVLDGRRALSPAATLAAAAGRTAKRFNARLGGRRLKPGRYRVRIGAVDAAGNAARPVSLAFAVRR